MQVILLEKNEKLGNLGDIANVKSGYARNYLIPQGKAKPANKANMAVFETIRADLEAKEVAALSDAESKELADDIPTGRIENCNWARDNKVNWDGITNRNLC